MIQFVYSKMLKVLKYYRENGLGKTVQYSFFRIIDFLVQSLEYIGFTFLRKDLIFFERELEPNEFKPLHGDSEIECVRIGKMEVEKFNNYFDGWFDRKQALNRLEEGRILLAGKMNGEVVAYFWAEPKKVVVPSLDLSFGIPESTACVAYIFTVPEHRGKGIASKVIPYVLRDLSNIGYRHLFLLIAPRNIASQRLNRKVGFADYQRVTSKRFLFLNHLFLKYYWVKDMHSNRRKIFFGGSEETQSKIWQGFSKLRRTKDKKDQKRVRVDRSPQTGVGTRELENSRIL